MRFFYILTLLAFLLPIAVCAQRNSNDAITGLWTGTLHNDSTGSSCNYEIAITKDKGKLTGFSHTWFVVAGKQYYGVKKVAIKNAPDGKIIIVDAELLDNDYPEETKFVPQLNVLTLQQANGHAILSGPFVTNRTKAYQAVTGHVKLTRNNVHLQSALWPHIRQLGKEKDFSLTTITLH